MKKLLYALMLACAGCGAEPSFESTQPKARIEAVSEQPKIAAPMASSASEPPRKFRTPDNKAPILYNAEAGRPLYINLSNHFTNGTYHSTIGTVAGSMLVINSPEPGRITGEVFACIDDCVSQTAVINVREPYKNLYLIFPFSHITSYENQDIAIPDFRSHFSKSSLDYSVSGFENIAAVIGKQDIKLIPPKYWNGKDRGFITACDEEKCITAPIKVKVRDVNHPPTTKKRFWAVGIENTPVVLKNISRYFKDPDKDKLSFNVGGFSSVSAFYFDDSIMVSPPQDWAGKDEGIVKACDPGGMCVTAPVIVRYRTLEDAFSSQRLILYSSEEGSYLDGFIQTSDLFGENPQCSLLNHDGLASLMIYSDCTITSREPVSYGSSGQYLIEARVATDKMSYDFRLLLKVDKKNRQPEITDVIAEGNQIDVIAQDPDNDELSCTSVSAPSNLTQSGCTFYSEQLESGTYEFKVTDGELEDSYVIEL
ncbi:MAG: hypothetical protein KKE20_05730 [Nanoarchaeota archaeon]|nr:hypothetical protein [Nanoarchaeota archaeon]